MTGGYVWGGMSTPSSSYRGHYERSNVTYKHKIKPAAQPCRSEQIRRVFLIIGWRNCEACDTSAWHVHRYRSSEYPIRPSLALALLSGYQADHSLDFLAATMTQKTRTSETSPPSLRCIRIQPFSNSSELLIISCFRKYFMMISETVQQLSRRQTNTHTHKQTLLKTIPPSLRYRCGRSHVGTGRTTGRTHSGTDKVII